jgi:asparagine synthase (glutamine-hydrolysing)
MSGFACILDRRGAPVDSRRIDRLGDSLADYGDASSTLYAGPLGIVVRHERSDRARECHGPIRDDRSGLVVAVAGRFSLTGETGSPSARTSGDPAEAGCARWALKRWCSDGGSWLNEIAGSFTLVVADPDAGWLSIARDHLGDLKVYYHLSERLLIAASEAAAILSGDAVAAEPDEHSVARFLGFRFGHTERSFFRRIRELAPANRLRASRDDAGTEAYWRFRHTKGRSTARVEGGRGAQMGIAGSDWLGKSESPVPQDGVGGTRAAAHEVCDAFLDHLRRSVRHHLNGLPNDQVGLSLSGGLDSSALAAVAPRTIRAYSWFFEATADPAESNNIEAVSRHLDLPVRWISGDEHGPLSGDFCSTFVRASSPYVNPFAALKMQLYSAARSDGCRRMIVGDGGDVVYGARHFWLRDALTEGQPWALSSVARTVMQALRGDPFCRAALRRLVPLQGIGRAVRRRKAPPWLTKEAVSLLPPERLSPILPGGSAGYRYDLSVGARNIELESEERRLFCQCGLERANPFWHRPLLEMVLRLPAYWFHRDGRDKVLAREALKNLLPARVLESGRVGLLGAFFLRGIETRRQVLSESVFRRPKSDWQRYVRREWLEPYLAATDSISFGHTILWRTISYELWFRRVWAHDSGDGRGWGA